MWNPKYEEKTVLVILFLFLTESSSSSENPSTWPGKCTTGVS